MFLRSFDLIFVIGFFGWKKFRNFWIKLEKLKLIYVFLLIKFLILVLFLIFLIFWWLVLVKLFWLYLFLFFIVSVKIFILIKKIVKFLCI